MKSYLTFKQLAYITGLNRGTILTYCQSWLLARYMGMHGTYEYTEESINKLYTYLDLKHKFEEMKKLKKHFSFAKLVEVDNE